jgi:predicted metalloprotease with PDZ domain
MSAYLGNPHSRFSAEQASRLAFNSDVKGESQPDVWLQGELLSAMLDLTIRDATDGERSLDDLMRAMFAHFSGERGFTTADVERLAGEVCGCNLAPFFDAYVRGTKEIDSNDHLRLAGLKMEVQWKKATRKGTLLPDRRFYFSGSEGSPVFVFFNPDNQWVRAGLRTGDRLVKLNGSAAVTVADAYKLFEPLNVGDRVTLEVMRAGTARQVTAVIESYDRPEVKIHELANPNERQKAILARWSAGQ